MGERNDYLRDHTLPKAPEEAVALIKNRAREAAVMVFTTPNNKIGKSSGSGYAAGDYIVTNYHVINASSFEANGQHYAMLVDHQNRVGFGEVTDFNSLSACVEESRISISNGLIDTAILRPIDNSAEPELYVHLMQHYLQDISSNKFQFFGTFQPEPYSLEDLEAGLSEIHATPEEALIPIVMTGNPSENIYDLPAEHTLKQHTGSVNFFTSNSITNAQVLTPEGEHVLHGESGSLGVSLRTGLPVMHIIGSNKDMRHPHHATHHTDKSYGASIEHVYHRLKELPETVPPLHSLDCTPLNLEWANTLDSSEVSPPTALPASYQASEEVVR